MKENNQAFSISYSGATHDELQKIKEKYTQSETSQKLNEIKRLDARVDFVSTMLSIGLGIIGTILLAHGIIFIVQNPDKLFLGCVPTLLGLIIDAIVPIVHFRIAKKIKKRTAPKILALIKEVEQSQL